MTSVATKATIVEPCLLPPPTASRRHSVCTEHSDNTTLLQTATTDVQRRQSLDIQGQQQYTASNVSQSSLHTESLKVEQQDAEPLQFQKPFDPALSKPAPVSTSFLGVTTNSTEFQTPNTPDDVRPASPALSPTGSSQNDVSSASSSSSSTCYCSQPDEAEKKPKRNLSVSTHMLPTTEQQKASPSGQKIPSPWASTTSLAQHASPVTASPTTPADATRSPKNLPDLTHASVVASITAAAVASTPTTPTTMAARAASKGSVAAAPMDSECMATPVPERYTNIVSFTLTNDVMALKTFRRMATKVKDSSVQLAYAKYLIDMSGQLATGTATRTRLEHEAHYWIKRLARRKADKEALLLYGRQLMMQPLERENGVRCLEEAARLGSAEAYHDLGEFYAIEKQHDKALQCYGRAASQGHILANFKLARALLNQAGTENPVALARGMQALQKAAESDQDDGRAAFALSCIHAGEPGLAGIQCPISDTVDINEAMRYLKKAARLNYMDALHRIGLVHKYGLLQQPHDPWQGYQCFVKAAEEGHAGAMLELAKVHAEGITGYLMPQPDTALRWCQRAAERGYSEAEYLLGVFYEEGRGLPAADYPRALQWFGKAASKGHRDAAQKLNLPDVLTHSPVPPSTPRHIPKPRRFQPFNCNIM
ncbi:hypothetical protein BCR43DRAFT_505882 [Syncephalastrum racemosum]|uniref:HCP-like protein n=1 Tax=Syncephalastrum racemosum TaxID=13706 RepID=A0A1X2H9N9_SYNRA|nr:hypothetical protein BCR43DRAFT_505882 [Syncephalastrum racemosum]